MFWVLKKSQSLRDGKRPTSEKFHPTFKDFDTRQANELLIESFLNEGTNPRFRPSLKNFTDNPTIDHVCQMNDSPRNIIQLSIWRVGGSWNSSYSSQVLHHGYSLLNILNMIKLSEALSLDIIIIT